jgi:putative membrane protein
MMGFGFIWILIVWGIIIAAAIWLGKTLLNRDGDLGSLLAGSGKRSAIDILENRYARGEITREEFEIMKKDIAKA